MKKIVICGVPGSDNLGDAVIAECLALHFETYLKVKAIKCDISYREHVEYDGIKGNNLTLFNRLPRPFRQCAVLIFFSIKYLRTGRSFLEQKMKGADLVVVGGGQLISDVDWNFPLKLYFITKTAEKLNIPIKIVAVGVANKWSRGGKLLMSKLFNSKKLISIGVRDELSRQNLVRHFSIKNSETIPDPAMMCSILMPENEKIKAKKIGLGVADLAGLNYSSDIVNEDAVNSLQCWDNLFSELAKIDRTIILFTNGAKEDEQFLHQTLVPFLLANERVFEIRSRFKSSKEMVTFVASLHSLIAFRLHSNIIAASFEIPHYAIGWDNKVISFFKMQDRADCVFPSLNALVLELRNEGLKETFKTRLHPELVFRQYNEYFGPFN